MNFIIKLISDSSGNPSTMRIMALLTALGVIVPKLVGAVKGQPVAWSEYDLGILATAFAGKTAQSFAENKAPEQPKPPTP